ncbi:MAG: DUF4389 domain-containing protein [Nanoarchaeota archaeon]
MISERKEIFMRILVCIVTGIMLSFWKMLIKVLALVHWVYVLFTGKRSKDLAVFSEIWNSQLYKFVKYLTFVTNERPFPFNKLGNNLSNFDAKLNK